MRLIASRSTCPVCAGRLHVEEGMSTTSRVLSLDIGCTECSATFEHISSDYEGFELEFTGFHNSTEAAERMIELVKETR